MTTLRDALGVELKVGQRVAWGIAGWTRWGVVTSLTPKAEHPHERAGPRVRVKGQSGGPGGDLLCAMLVVTMGQDGTIIQED